ncbi:hypothetical protein WJX84_000236 [Apatococcus fuscideae]|uniref:Sulfotransferase n=1 Tax=Apatococcus fuscideae TaxID=2026836 RepID=A0AAW1SZ45_9CHLO
MQSVLNLQTTPDPLENREEVHLGWNGETCYNGECEALHLTQAQRSIHQLHPQPPDATPTLIIAAGPERSGSTWLFNAVRLLYEAAGVPLDCYWMTHVTDRKLHQRGAGQKGRSNILVKTHGWSDNWTPSAADHILLTHRHLAGVLASYHRVGWAFDIPDSYVNEHQRWKAVAHHDFAFEDVVQQSEEELRKLAQRLDLLEQVDIQLVQSAIDALKPPASGPPDPVTKLWPQHMSPEVSRQLAAGSGLAPAENPGSSSSSKQAARLRARFPTFFKQYGYE